MKLTETIKICRTLIEEEIEGIEYYIEQYENKNLKIVSQWKKDVENFKQHLENLNIISHKIEKVNE